MIDAKLSDAIETVRNWLPAERSATITAKLEAAITAHEQQLLTELLKHRASLVVAGISTIDNGTGGGYSNTVGVVPVSVIQRLQNKTNDGGQNGDSEQP